MKSDTKASDEPVMVCQNGDAKTMDEKSAWFQLQADEANKKGLIFRRFTEHGSIPNLILFEAWDHVPKEQGEARFMLVKNHD